MAQAAAVEVILLQLQKAVAAGVLVTQHLVRKDLVKLILEAEALGELVVLVQL